MGTATSVLVERVRDVLHGLGTRRIVVSTDACCGPCASEQVCLAYDNDSAAVGSAYFHAGDITHAEAHGVLRITVESGIGDEEECEVLARLVSDAMRAAGLLANWTITDHARLEVRLKQEELTHA